MNRGDASVHARHSSPHSPRPRELAFEDEVPLVGTLVNVALGPAHPCALQDLLEGYERFDHEVARIGPTLLLIQEWQYVKPNRPLGQRAASLGVEPTEPRERALVLGERLIEDDEVADRLASVPAVARGPWGGVVA